LAFRIPHKIHGAKVTNHLKRWWPLCKLLLAVVILLAIGRRFYFDLQDPILEDVTIRPGWVLVSACLYVVGQGFSAAFWHHLMRVFGDKPRRWASVRAYYISQLGKYVPGKAWALILRSALVRGPDVRLGVAAITAFYEVLTTMAAGVLLAACIFLVQTPEIPGLTWSPVLTGLLLLALVGVPLLPGVFNLLVSRLAGRFERVESYRLPRLRHRTLATGILEVACGWIIMGTSLWAMLQAVLPSPPELSVSVWATCAASLALAYVAGFLAIVVPGGLGVREFFLQPLLGPFAPEALILVAVLVLRLAWTGAELVVAAIAYCVPARPFSGSREELTKA
jgi:uncharacterized membrane protein YbhN (UPF0104 family)